MDALQLRVSGRWAQFRKPETNNSPLTHDFITKTAFIGMMGAVLGIERIPTMRELFPHWCEDFRFGVCVRGVVKKESWGFTLRRASKYEDVYNSRQLESLNTKNRAPKQMEFLREPNFIVTLALVGQRSASYFHAFGQRLQNEEACYTPVLGLHNCPAELRWVGFTSCQEKNGPYQTSGFVLRADCQALRSLQNGARIAVERMPTFQDNDWFNVPSAYREILYSSPPLPLPEEDQGIQPNAPLLHAAGNHFYLGNDESWCLI